MGDSISSWLQNLFGSNQNAGVSGVPLTPGQTGLGITAGAPANQFNTPGFDALSNNPSMLQYGQFGLSALGGLGQGILGFQNMSLAKKQLNQAQDNWNKQWDANKQTTNAALEDRQRARTASNPNAYESVDSYMKKYGIK